MAVKKRLTAEQVEGSTMALAFVRALLLGTDPKVNKGHEVNPCPVAFWEDSYQMDDELIKLAKGKNASHRPTQDNK